MKEHRFITTERIFKNGAVNFGRNIYLSIAAIAMIAITLTILLFAIITNVTFRHSINDLTSHINISVFLKDSVTDQQRDDLISRLSQQPNVESVHYTNKADALKKYEADNAQNNVLLNALAETGNVLPASLEVKPRDPNNLQPIRDFINQPNIKAFQTTNNSDTSQQKEKAIGNITKATHFIEQSGIVGIIVFMLISTMIIFNTIRMAIFNRREELVIMRLLGASTWYIRGPFVVESMLYGVAAAIFSLVICWALFAVASSTLQASSLGLLDITYSSHYFNSHLWQIILVQLMAGIIIGAASSAIATRRYLKLNR